MDDGGEDISFVPLLPPPSTPGAGTVVVDDDWQYIRVWDRSSSGEIIRTEALS
jgi:hypothetical protein